MKFKSVVTTVVSLSCVIGCHTQHEAPPPRAVIIDRGYYYDAEYRDEYGRYHPRTFWYYDGRQYVAHEAPPPNVIVHERVQINAHGRPGEFHEGDREVPGERLHGGELNHDDRPGELSPRDR